MKLKRHRAEWLTAQCLSSKEMQVNIAPKILAERDSRNKLVIDNARRALEILAARGVTIELDDRGELVIQHHYKFRTGLLVADSKAHRA